MAAGDVPPQVQNQLRQYQETQEKLQQLLDQKQQMDMKVQELERTVEALDDVDDDQPVYRNVGRVLVGVDNPEDLREDLAEEKETIEVRLNSLENQEEGLRDRMETLQETLEDLMGGQAAQGPQ
jgi:prefoldin beta subunit